MVVDHVALGSMFLQFAMRLILRFTRSFVKGKMHWAARSSPENKRP
jgi:hypothetical protein